MRLNIYLLFFLIIIVSCTENEMELSKEAVSGFESKSLVAEKAKLETAVSVYALLGEDITDKVIMPKIGQVLNPNILVKVKSIGLSNELSEESLFFDNGRVIIGKENNNLDKNGNTNSEVVTLELSEGNNKTTFEVLVVINPEVSKNQRTYYIPNEINNNQIHDRSINIDKDKTFLGVGYDVINSSYINRDDAKIGNPALDIKKLNEDKVIFQEDATQTIWKSNTEESIHSLQQERYGSAATKVGIGLFSAEFGVKYKETHNSKKTNKFAYLRSDHRVIEEYIKNSNAAKIAKYITNDFLQAIDKDPASEIIKKYGTHIFIRCYHGGSAEYSFSYSGTQIKSTQELDTHIKAGYKFITAEASYGNSTTREDFKSNTSIEFRSVGGGNFAAATKEQFEAKYPAWVESIKKYPNLCGIGDFDQSLLPIWEIIKIRNSTKAKEVENEFNKMRKEREQEILNTHNFVTYISAWEQQHISPYPNNPLTQYVKREKYRSEEGAGEILDANRKAKGAYIRIAYTLASRKSSNPYKIPIADIVILEGENAAAPRGYKKINMDLNKGARGKYLYLAYREINASDTEAIDYIGSYSDKNQPEAFLEGNWHWVNLYNTNEWCDLNKGAKGKGDYIYLTVHKTKLHNNYYK